jgi:hypothetical protein
MLHENRIKLTSSQLSLNPRETISKRTVKVRTGTFPIVKWFLILLGKGSSHFLYDRFHPFQYVLEDLSQVSKKHTTYSS